MIDTTTKYDVILIFAYSRIHNHYLNIAKYLGKELKIGIYISDVGKASRTKDTDSLFCSLCAGFGVEILPPGKYQCNLLVIPRYSEDGFVEAIKKNIKYKSAIILQTFGYGTENLEPLLGLGVEKLFVYDKNVFKNKLKTEEQRKFIEKHLEIVEMGSPFAKYPVFDDLNADYMVALPTRLSLVDAESVESFLKNTLKILEKLNPEDRVLLKAHNVRDHEVALLPVNLFIGASQIKLRPWALRIITSVAEFLSIIIKTVPILSRKRQMATHLLSGLLYASLRAKTAPLYNSTHYHNFGIELFLPGVKKGLITGRTSSVWYALCNRLPVYNCDNETKRAIGEGVTDSFKSFGVSPSQGELIFDSSNFNKISDTTREADLLELIRKEL